MNVADSAAIMSKPDTVFVNTIQIIRDTIDNSRETIIYKYDSIVNQLKGDTVLVKIFEGLNTADLDQLRENLEKRRREIT